MRPLFMVLLLLSGCAALSAEHTIKLNKGPATQAPKPETIPGKHHCDIGEEVECCCLRDVTGKISNCTCVEK